MEASFKAHFFGLNKALRWFENMNDALKFSLLPAARQGCNNYKGIGLIKNFLEDMCLNLSSEPLISYRIYIIFQRTVSSSLAGGKCCFRNEALL